MVLDTIRERFTSSFKPYKNVVIDESLALWRGHISFQQYIKTKRHRFGFKFFVLCDCRTGYVQDIILYTGKTTEIVPTRDLGVSGAVVITLMEKYLNAGHVVFTDNYYTSPLLANYLMKHQTGLCGTVKRYRKCMPRVQLLKKKR